MTNYACISFHQYETQTNEDELVLFAAPAKAIAAWAGIPRKGWNIRMLYQRWITPSREREVTDFWRHASTKGDAIGSYILGPTALTIAMHDPAPISRDRIRLEYTSPIQPGTSPLDNLKSLATQVLTHIRPRLSAEQRQVLDDFRRDPFHDIPDTEHDYVLESAMQFAQIESDPCWFKGHYHLDDQAINDIIVSLEAICRPALVVDGQHRLFGAANCDNDIWLPVVAIPNCSWAEQIYQFVVINEKAQRVETSLLTDIFGSSLTRSEQQSLRRKLERSNVHVEERIAAVIASRDPESPFYEMVQIKLEGSPPGGGRPFIPESTIRTLIEGGRGTPGWRTADEFYEHYVSPNFPVRADWDSWTSGRWREYWFCFWRTVAEFYDQQAQAETGDTTQLLWDRASLTNLTKSVTMRLFQRLFMEKAADRVRQVKQSRDLLVDVVGEKRADEEIAKKIKDVCIPQTVGDFRSDLQEWFLRKGVPVRFFLKPWRGSLDDTQGQADLWDEMEKAFTYNQEGKRYHTRNVNVFSTDES